MRICKISSNDFRSVCTEILDRTDDNFADVDAKVAGIVNDIRNRKDEALFEYTQKFDKVQLNEILVSEAEIDDALSLIDPQFLEILRRAKTNIENFHKKQLQSSWFSYGKHGAKQEVDDFNELTDYNPDIILGQKVSAINRVGVYVPGGTAAYPSTVLMDTIPAVVAGVKEIAISTPPQLDGTVNPNILAAAHICGVTEIYKMGGAQAIAALAYGTQSVKPVNKIVGPGNIFVARAKKHVFGKVDIDMIAGPSEVLVIADQWANPKFIAADLLAQAEHDKLACSILVTDSESLAKKVDMEISHQLSYLERKEIAQESIENVGWIFVVDSLDDAFELSNEIAPEHLELSIKNAVAYVDKVQNAGAIFVGEYSPEPLGDYYAGPNHTLPTSSTAKFSSALGVDAFIKKSSIIYYNDENLSNVCDDIIEFADVEGLSAHANSIKVRFE
ncbi:MAG: histidinol dehydrogenase [Coriobacteriales bacterium]|nr:histidinol dehydrogenase [Coriobacteriales bacterium]